MRASCLAASAIAIGLAVPALGQVTWAFDITDPSGNSNGGDIDTISSIFRPSDSTFEWTVRFDDQITEGYTLAVSPGPNPKGHEGELALVYFDASDGAPIVSVYGYNGKNNSSSFMDGGNASGIQTPDRIVSSLDDASFIMEASVVDDVMGGRTFTLKMDASAIQAYGGSLLNPAPTPTDWTGVAYGDAIGVWFHPYKNLSTSYIGDGEEGENYLASWSGSDGWFDGRDFTTTPAPGSAALIALSGILAARRKRS